jgi:hypothetical protein
MFIITIVAQGMSQKNYMSLILFGPLKLNLLFALTYTRHKRKKLNSDLMLLNVIKIFDELLKTDNIKFSHTTPPIEELKRHMYCKWHGSFFHDTNDCNVFHRQIESAINEGQLRFQEMKIDMPPIPVSTLESTSKKILVQPCVADKGKGKHYYW